VETDPSRLSTVSLTVLTSCVDVRRVQVTFDVVLTKEGVGLGPLKLKAFKAVASDSKVDSRFKPFNECEIDPSSCLML